VTASTRQFPVPWTVVELPQAFLIEDANKFTLAYVYFAEDSQRQGATGRMSKDEARRIAIGMAALPDLRAELRDQEKRF
jgi:hypothetical protein